MREIFLCPDGGGKLGKGGAVCVGKWGKNVREGLKKRSRGIGKARRGKSRKKEGQALGKNRDEKEQTKNGGDVPPFLVAGEAGLEPAIY